jgi:ribosomal protein L16
MPLMPKRVKYRKSQRGSRKGTASRNLRIDFGEFGLQTLERAWITNTQIEAARVALTRNMKRKGKLWIRIFPDKSVTARPPETRWVKAKASRNETDEQFRSRARYGTQAVCLCAPRIFYPRLFGSAEWNSAGRTDCKSVFRVRVTIKKV